MDGASRVPAKGGATAVRSGTLSVTVGETVTMHSFGAQSLTVRSKIPCNALQHVLRLGAITSCRRLEGVTRTLHVPLSSVVTSTRRLAGSTKIVRSCRTASGQRASDSRRGVSVST